MSIPKFPPWYYKFLDKENTSKNLKEETPSTPLLSQEALLTLLLIYLNRKEGTSGSTRIQWGFKGYEYKVLGELTQRGLITNPIGGKKADSLWLTQAGSALGNLIGNMLLPEIERVTKALKTQEMP